MTAETQPKTEKRRSSMCVGCGGQIMDQFILRVAPDLEWHAACLKCADCNQFLDETCTCFVRDGKTYCKRDYVRLFGTKCAKCCVGFSKNDFVMRAKSKIYHIDCFRCVACSRQLIPGDEFALRDDGLFCKADHEVVERAGVTSNGGNNCTDSDNNNLNGERNNNNNNDEKKPNLHRAGHAEPVTTSSSENRRQERRQVHKEHKPTRVRTVLNEKQLHTLRTCYNANPRPDALMKEQLVEMTSLSPRVIRVWFQNKRCKDKKKSIAMKQMQQQMEKNGQLPRPMSGVPMIASSPVRHEQNLQPNPVEVTSYQPPWKALSDFAMQSELDQQPYQQLMYDSNSCDMDMDNAVFKGFASEVNQIHSYDHMDNLSNESGCVNEMYDGMSHPPTSVSTDIPGSPSDFGSPMSQ